MKTKYQILFIGDINIYEDEIKSRLRHHIAELGIDFDESIIFIDDENFHKDYSANSPVVCIYFGNKRRVFNDIDLLRVLIGHGTIIIPVVQNLEGFADSTPNELHNINGYQLSSIEDIEPLVSCVLEGLGLLRLARRVFISYKRDESSTVAIQLFEQLEKKGFDVFLDTHSIRPSEPFQEELWHRLADTDVVVLLNTPGFLKSNWTTEELAQANSMSIGILQLIWPEHELELEAKISIPYQLEDSDFGNKNYANQKSYLLDNTISKIASLTESLRARSLAARQDNIITEFISAAKMLAVTINIQPEKFLTIKKSNGKELVIIPTVGVPQAFTYNQSEELVARIKSKKVDGIFLLYDHRNIREKWLKHLDWLDGYLPIKGIKIVNAETWIKGNA